MNLPYVKVKRTLDVAVAGVGIAATAPVQLVVAGLVRWKLGSPVLFRQERPGLQGRTFELLKFRTMHNPDTESGLVSDEDRLTPFGTFLRSTSLDELPSLWNVLRGDMSVVGPRPLLKEYLQHYTPDQAIRHDVRPGITGLAQVNGRNSATWDERLALDAKYVRDFSFRLDLSVILRTVCTVVRRSGVSAEGHVTMPRFDEDMVTP